MWKEKRIVGKERERKIRRIVKKKVNGERKIVKVSSYERKEREENDYRQDERGCKE